MTKPKRDLVEIFKKNEEAFDFDDYELNFENDAGSAWKPNADPKQAGDILDILIEQEERGFAA